LFVEKVVNDIKPDIIVWTGDNPPHNPWNENSQEIFNITQVFVDLLYEKYKYKGAVFPSLGNHEEYITDQYNPFDSSREKEFLQKMGDIFRVFLGDEQHETFVKYGFYTAKYANTNLRIISINCFLCDVMNFFLIRDPTDPGKQFEWLEKVLREAERDGEYVFIIGHIPPGDSTYLSECSKRYNAIVDRFSNTIRGQFYGHTHYDEFRIITEYFNEEKIAGIILTAPSLTSYSWKNPSFRVYEVDSKTSIIKDYYQYRLNLTEANLNPYDKPDWKVAYTAKEVKFF
jgi:sphingomyelin phosphodiesterase